MGGCHFCMIAIDPNEGRYIAGLRAQGEGGNAMMNLVYEKMALVLISPRPALFLSDKTEPTWCEYSGRCKDGSKKTA